MNKSRFRKDRKATMGISAMIIFIAMILVAAMAAYVVIDVARSLQERLRVTGVETEAEIATGVLLSEVMGDRCRHAIKSPVLAKDIQILAITLRLSPGSPAISLDSLIVRVSDPSTQAELKCADRLGQAIYTDPNHYSVEAVRDRDNSVNVYRSIDSRDIVKIYIDLAQCGLTLGPNDAVLLQLLPEVGPGTMTELTAPSTFGGRYVPLV